MECPKYIILQTEDDEYIVARHEKDVEDADENIIPIYKQLFYCHTLKSAIDCI